MSQRSYPEKQLPMPTAMVDLDETFLQQLYKDIQSEGLECASLGVVMELADTGEFGVVADLLGRMAEDDHSEWAAAVCTKLVEQSKSQGGVTSNYSVVALLLGQLVDEQRADAASDILGQLLKSDSAASVTLAALCMGQMLKFHRTDWTNGVIACSSYPEAPKPGGGPSNLDALDRLLTELLAQDQVKWAATMAMQMEHNNRPDVLKRIVRGVLANAGEKGLLRLLEELKTNPKARNVTPLVQEVLGAAGTNGSAAPAKPNATPS